MRSFNDLLGVIVGETRGAFVMGLTAVPPFLSHASMALLSYEYLDLRRFGCIEKGLNE